MVILVVMVASHGILVNQKLKYTVAHGNPALAFSRIQTSWSEPVLCESCPASEWRSSSPSWCWPSKRLPLICPHMSGRRLLTLFPNSTGDIMTQTKYWRLVCVPETTGQTNMKCWNDDTSNFKNEKEDFPRDMSCYDYWYSQMKALYGCETSIQQRSITSPTARLFVLFSTVDFSF